MYGLCGHNYQVGNSQKFKKKKLSLRISLRENFEAKVLNQVY